MKIAAKERAESNEILRKSRIAVIKPELLDLKFIYLNF